MTRKNAFTQDQGHGGQTYLEAIIKQSMGGRKYSAAAKQKVFERLVAAEQERLAKEGVRYRLNAIGH